MRKSTANVPTILCSHLSATVSSRFNCDANGFSAALNSALAFCWFISSWGFFFLGFGWGFPKPFPEPGSASCTKSTCFQRCQNLIQFKKWIEIWKMNKTSSEEDLAQSYSSCAAPNQMMSMQLRLLFNFVEEVLNKETGLAVSVIMKGVSRFHWGTMQTCWSWTSTVLEFCERSQCHIFPRSVGHTQWLCWQQQCKQCAIAIFQCDQNEIVQIDRKTIALAIACATLELPRDSEI